MLKLTNAQLMNKTKGVLQVPISYRDFTRNYLKSPKNSSSPKSKENKEKYQTKIVQNQNKFSHILSYLW